MPPIYLLTNIALTNILNKLSTLLNKAKEYFVKTKPKGNMYLITFKKRYIYKCLDYIPFRFHCDCTRNLYYNFVIMLNDYLFILCCTFFILTLIKYHVRRLHIYKCSYLLDGPFAWPIIGNALWCLGKSEDIIRNALILCSTYQSPFRFWLGSKLVVVITKPRDLEIVLNSCVHKEECLMRFLRPFVGNGLITVQSLEWKQNRKIINPTFSTKIINSFIPTFTQYTNILIQKLKTQLHQDIDIYKFVSLNTLDFTCDTTMGLKVNAQNEHSEYAVTLHRVLRVAFQRMTQIWSHIDFIFYKTTTGMKFKKDVTAIHNFAKKVLTKKQTQINKLSPEDSKSKPFLEHLLELQINETHLFDEINTFIAAGTDTVSSIISFVCIILGSHQDIQEKVYEEILRVIENVDDLTSENLQKLEYLERVIKETMRLFPATPFLIRSATEPIQLESCLIPCNTAVLYMILHIHRDPSIWPDPFKFDPDRFLPENSSQHSFSYLPFGAGLRYCIGKRYAMISMKIVLAMLVKNYKFYSNCDIRTMRLESTIVLRPVLGFLVRLESR